MFLGQREFTANTAGRQADRQAGRAELPFAVCRRKNWNSLTKLSQVVNNVSGLTPPVFLTTSRAVSRLVSECFSGGVWTSLTFSATYFQEGRGGSCALGSHLWTCLGVGSDSSGTPGYFEGGDLFFFLSCNNTQICMLESTDSVWNHEDLVY